MPNPIRDAYGVAPEPQGRDAIVQALYSKVQGASQPAINTAQYLAGVPMNVEGLLDNFVKKFGVDAGRQLMKQLPNMNLQQLRSVEAAVSGASSEQDAEVRREGRGIPAPQ